jgi:hypothetical protein
MIIYDHNHADKKEQACDGELEPSFSFDPAYDRWQCVKCGLGLNIKKESKK